MLAAQASKIYLAALALHDGGCKLTPRQFFALIVGASATLAARRKHAQALWLWQRARKLWPSSARVRYELARTLCAMGDTRRCFDELRDALDVGRLQRPPAFMRGLAGADQAPARILARVDKDRAFKRLRRLARYRRLRASPRYR